MGAERTNWFGVRRAMLEALAAVEGAPAAEGATALALALAIWARANNRTDEQVFALVREALACADDDKPPSAA